MEGLGKHTMKLSIVSVLVEVRTEYYHPNTNLERYCYVNPLSNTWTSFSYIKKTLKLIETLNAVSITLIVLQKLYTDTKKPDTVNITS